MSKHRHYETGNLEIEQTIAVLPAHMMNMGPLEIVREKTKAFGDAQPKVFEGVKTEDVQIPVDGGSIMVRTYIPEKDSHDLPLLVWFHGGGYAAGNPDLDNPYCFNACHTLNIAVVSVDYRLSPEYPFPTGINDSYEALKWAASHAQDLGVNLEKGFIVGGYSAGGNFSAVLSLIARDDPEFKWKLTGQYLSASQLCQPSAYPAKLNEELQSFHDLANAPLLHRTDILLFAEKYEVPDPSNWKASPLLAPSHANLPPAVIQAGGLDPFRDENILYNQLLKESGVSTRLHVYPALPHAMPLFLPQLQVSQKYWGDSLIGIQWLLNGAPQS